MNDDYPYVEGEHLTDAEIEGIFSRRGIDPMLEGALDDLRAAYVRPLDDEIARRDLERLRQHLRGEGGAVIDLARRRRWPAVMAIGGAALLGTSGLAAADMLPPPVQDVVAAIVEPVGLDLPSSDDDAPSSPSKEDGPGLSEDAPGQGGTGPGNSENTPAVTAPGQTGETPAVTAPGQTGETPAVTAPGQTGETPPVSPPGGKPGR